MFTDETLEGKSEGTTNIDYSDALYNEFQTSIIVPPV